MTSTIKDARQKFDERDYAGAIGILNPIVQSFPEFAAQSLLEEPCPVMVSGRN